MSVVTEVMFGNDDSECAKLGRDAMELGEGIVWVCELVGVLEEVIVDMEEEEEDLLKDMGGCLDSDRGFSMVITTMGVGDTRRRAEVQSQGEEGGIK